MGVLYPVVNRQFADDLRHAQKSRHRHKVASCVKFSFQQCDSFVLHLKFYHSNALKLTQKHPETLFLTSQ